jgi:predicted kinase
MPISAYVKPDEWMRALFGVDLPPAVLWERIERRNADLPAGTFAVSRAGLEDWARRCEVPTPGELERWDRALVVKG